MARKPVLMIGNEMLRKKSENIDLGMDDIERCVKDLKDTLHHLQVTKKTGRALAGPQIGYLKRVVYMEAGGIKIVMINPVIINKSSEKFEVWDSCFSADIAFFGKVFRYKTITVEYYDEQQIKVVKEFENDLSELFQHEIDHLDGILFTDHIIDNQIIMRSEWEKL